ncbi:hypothetical protein Zmor_000560 [Zophobas morio]|uniref:Secreted protein n=1 Tax=Zophobas morio TaxID=2755281 RepID=A0AA38MNN0_9CUCU|nr:hypothetical protein Zmor_000560 [Zophobas morio]
MILISCLVNLVSLQRSSRATGTGFGTLDGSISNTTSSMGLSDGVAMSLTLLLRPEDNTCSHSTATALFYHLPPSNLFRSISINRGPDLDCPN